MARWSQGALVAILAVAVSGCIYVKPPHRHPARPVKVVVVEKAKNEPPRHGHHRRHKGVEIVFDAPLGVYVVIGHPRHYFHGSRFYRLTHAGWQVSVRLDRGWVKVRSHDLPKGLHVVKAGKKGKHRHHPAKIRD